MNRSDARGLWAASGLTFRDLTHAMLRDLRKSVQAEMIAGGHIRNSLRARQRFSIKERQIALRCKGAYFDDREAITFYDDGFVGFAGWADDKNIQPILKGFCAWLQKLRPEQCADHASSSQISDVSA